MRILFCSLDAYSLFNTKTNFIFGGAEIRSVTIAKVFSDRFNHLVYFFTRNQGFESENWNNIHVLPFPGKLGNGYWSRQSTLIQKIKNKFSVFKKKINPSLSEVIHKIKPDFIISFSLSKETVELFDVASTLNIPFILGFTSDRNLELNKVVDERLKQSYLNLLHKVKIVMTQNEFQQQELWLRFNKIGFKMMNPISLKVGNDNVTVSHVDFLWVGKSSNVKRPEYFVKLSRELSSFSFRMVLNKADDSIYYNCLRDKPDNLEVINHISFKDIDNYYKSCKVFVNTSEYEGFPNSFLQAAKYKKPILSLNVNPDNFLLRFNCGMLASNSFEQLKAYAKSLISDTDLSSTLGENGFKYVAEFHEEVRVVETFNSILSEYSNFRDVQTHLN